jgi:riboflavin synthase alpha subunit
MFTGIVQHTARVASVSRLGVGARLAVENAFGEPPRSGESISVNGSCLTVVSANERQISFDLSTETLKKTIFRSVGPGAVVNLERALAVGQDISGHFVSGHVDGVGRVVSIEKSGEFAVLTFTSPEELAVYIVPKGSIAINGVSLTIASLSGTTFSVAVIPETLSRTNLSRLTPGEEVNIETDLLGKYVVRYLASMRGEGGGEISLDRLQELGY